MRRFGEEYLSNSAYFLAGGRTLEVIRQFENDVENRQALLDAIAHDYGANAVYGTERASFAASHKISSPALVFTNAYGGEEGALKTYYYEVNKATPEGRALQERLKDIPDRAASLVFAKRLTGDDFTSRNPDKLMDREMRSTKFGNDGDLTVAASYHKYGEVYVVEVPRTIRAIFTAASEKDSEKRHTQRAAGYRYEWFTPPDSEPLRDSQVLALREETELCDQTKPQSVRAKMNCCVMYPSSRVLYP